MLHMRNALFIAGIVLALAITALWIAFLAFELFGLLASWFQALERRMRSSAGRSSTFCHTHKKAPRRIAYHWGFRVNPQQDFGATISIRLQTAWSAYTAEDNIYLRYILAQKRIAKFDSGFVPLLH
jgi:hypothetical protein